MRAEGPRARAAAEVLAPSLLFVASFSAIFILLGLGATELGSTLNDHTDTLEHVSATIIIALGVFFLATPFVRGLNREWHVDGAHDARRPRRPARRRRRLRDRVDALRRPDARRDPQRRRAVGARRRTAPTCWPGTPPGLAIPFLLTAVAFNRMTTRLRARQASLHA